MDRLGSERTGIVDAIKFPQEGIKMSAQTQVGLASTNTDREQRLRTILYANVAFTAISALVLLLASRVVAQFLGLASGNFLLALGVGLAIFAADVAWVATRDNLNRSYVTTIAIADAFWVVGSIVLLVGGFVEFTTAGKWAVAIIADIVGIFGVLEFYGLLKWKQQS